MAVKAVCLDEGAQNSTSQTLMCTPVPWGLDKMQVLTHRAGAGPERPHLVPGSRALFIFYSQDPLVGNEINRMACDQYLKEIATE